VKSNRIWIVIFLVPAIIMFLLVYLGPLVTVIATSLTRWNGFNAPEFIGFKHYVDLFQSSQFRSALWNTVRWGLFAAFIHVPFGVLVALILAKKPKGWRFTRAVYMVPNIMGWTALSLLFLFIYLPRAGVLNGLIQALGFEGFEHNWLYAQQTAFPAVTMIWLFFAAVITLITISELLAIPDSLHESAKLDGASNFQIDWYINLPMIRPIIGTGVIVAVTAVFKQFEIIYLTTGGGPGNRTINISVMMVNRIFNSMEYGYANALAFILLVMGMIFIVTSQWAFRLGRGYHD
jgi:raffinose/stachyose/melibiose transport system permease protein